MRHAMSTADAAWLRMDRPTNLTIGNSVLWFDEHIDWDRCHAVVLERIVARFDRFRERRPTGSRSRTPHACRLCWRLLSSQQPFDDRRYDRARQRGR